jgi:peptidoglycan/LPS O-acetylase OafA/YrhL
MCLYLNFPVFAVLTVVLFKQASLSFISKPMDQWMGDLSYPIYLIHESVGLIVREFWPGNEVLLVNLRFSIMLISLPLMILIAWMLARLVGHSLEKIRSNIKRDIQVKETPG